MTQPPHILLIKTPMGHYFYEIGRNEIVCIEEDLFTYLKAIKDRSDLSTSVSEKVLKEFEELREYGYLQPNRIQEIIHPLTPDIHDMLDRKIEKITLQVTQACNLRCSYCVYGENGNSGQRRHSSKTMSFNVAKQALEFYRQHSIDAKTANIGFYGGEPLLAFPLIKQIVSYAEQIFCGKKIYFSLTTNATVLTDEVIEYILRKKIHLMFSIDGTEEVHNQNRKYADGRGSYHDAVQCIDKLYEVSPASFDEFSVNTVITPEQDYDKIIKLFKTSPFSKINLQSTLVESNGSFLRPADEYIYKYTKDYFWAIVRHLRGGNNPFKNKLVQQDVDAAISGAEKVKLNILGVRAAPSGPCVPGKTRLFITSDGDFFPCERVNEVDFLKIGSLSNGFDYDKVEELLNIGKVSPDRCSSCWAFSLCSICVKRVEDGGSLSPEKKEMACKSVKQQAYEKLLHKILLFESNIHNKKMKKEGVL